ncbi:hypothetical protein COOONC_28550 [Cooperia oncophora]
MEKAIKTTHDFNGTVLKTTEEVCNLGIHINSETDFRRHISTSVKMLLVARVTSIEPQYKKAPGKLEKVQRAFTKRLLHRCDPNPACRPVFDDIVFCFKLLEGELKPSSGRLGLVEALFFGATWLQLLQLEFSCSNISVFKSKLREADLLSILGIQES